MKTSLPILLASIASFLVFGCAEPAGDEPGAEEAAIVDVPQSSVEKQTIGNCWIYAHASWAESMYLQASGRSFDISQTYWTYWHWFEKIANGESQLSDGDIAGSWETASGLVQKYGLIDERTFLRADARGEGSTRQKEALVAINASLATGALRANRDRRLVRAEMDRVFGLGDAQRAMLDRVFGADASRTFKSGADNDGESILRAEQFPAAYAVAPGQRISTSLAQAMQDWRKVEYGGSAVIRRIQRAVHEQVPVYMTWLVDINALEDSGPMRGSFNLETLRANGAGRQGLHMTIVEDYQATLADGSVLPAGRIATAADRERALAERASVQFFRVKNSWGTSTASAPRMAGYHDLYMTYLNGPIAGRAPLRHVYLPRGF